MKVPVQVLAITTPLRLGLSTVLPRISDDLRVNLAQRVMQDGKFSKLQVLYTPVTLVPPVAWFYDCADCTFYKPADRSCAIVKGVIEPYAWCGLWVNRAADKPFSWIERGLS